MGVKCFYFTRLKYFFCVVELEPSISAPSEWLWAFWGSRTSTARWEQGPNGLCILLLNCRFLPLYHPKGGLFFSTLIPLIWFFLTPRWGQKQCSNKELWWCALKSTQTKFIYFSLGWRLGCVFFVQTLFLNSEAKHSLAFVGFFFFLELPFVCIGRKIALLLRISKSVLLLQPWRCGYIKERKGF